MCEVGGEKSAERESTGNLNMSNKRSLVGCKKVDRIPGIYTGENLKVWRWVAVKARPIASRSRTKINNY